MTHARARRLRVRRHSRPGRRLHSDESAARSGALRRGWRGRAQETSPMALRPVWAALAVVFLARTPGPVRRHYRQLVKNLVMQAIAD